MVGGFVDGAARTILWILFVVLMVGGLLITGEQSWMVRAGHFAERHGLIIIIALGEVIVAIGISVTSALSEADDGIPAQTLIGLGAAGVLAVLMWWAYFDRVLPALEHHLDNEPTTSRGSFARDVYTLAHVPIVAGIITTAAAAEEILLHPGDPVPGEFRIMFAAGMALFFGGVGIAVFRAFRVVAKERFLAMVAIVVLAVAATAVSGIVFLLIADAILFAGLVLEHQRIERIQASS